MEPFSLYLTAYGNCEAKEKGIVKLSYHPAERYFTGKECFPLQGKANMLIETESEFYLSQQIGNANYLEVYQKDGFCLKKRCATKYFFSYGQCRGDLLYLASFESGVDWVWNHKKECLVSENIHERNHETAGRSHYIQRLDANTILALDNDYDQIYFYGNDALEKRSVACYHNKRLRLLSRHPKKPLAYLSTEGSNEILIFRTTQWTLLDTVKMETTPGSTSGGNVVSPDGRYLCISMRGENVIYLYRIEPDGRLYLLQKRNCGAMPRDLKIVGQLLFVTCMQENTVEVYALCADGLVKWNEISVQTPITFALSSEK